MALNGACLRIHKIFYLASFHGIGPERIRTLLAQRIIQLWWSRFCERDTTGAIQAASLINTPKSPGAQLARQRGFNRQWLIVQPRGGDFAAQHRQGAP